MDLSIPTLWGHMPRGQLSLLGFLAALAGILQVLFLHSGIGKAYYYSSSKSGSDNFTATLPRHNTA